VALHHHPEQVDQVHFQHHQQQLDDQQFNNKDQHKQLQDEQ
jgi:hypothetical protein